MPERDPLKHVHRGYPGKSPANWRRAPASIGGNLGAARADEDEATDAERQGVRHVLGFDPRELDDDDDRGTDRGPAQKPNAPRGGKRV